MGQDEYIAMIGWTITPPAPPGVVGPSTAQRREHVPAQDPSAEVIGSAYREILIRSDRTAIVPQHLLKGARGKKPLVQRSCAYAQGVLKVLVRTCPESIE
jgi:hypothetical protein